MKVNFNPNNADVKYQSITFHHYYNWLLFLKLSFWGVRIVVKLYFFIVTDFGFEKKSGLENRLVLQIKIDLSRTESLNGRKDWCESLDLSLCYLSIKRILEKYSSSQFREVSEFFFRSRNQQFLNTDSVPFFWSVEQYSLNIKSCTLCSSLIKFTVVTKGFMIASTNDHIPSHLNPKAHTSVYPEQLTSSWVHQHCFEIASVGIGSA